MKKIENILIVAITRMGDMLQASPTFEGLRRKYPEARITALLDQQFAAICTGLPGINDVYVLDLSMIVRCLHRGADGIVEAYDYVSKMLADLRARNFDYVLNMSSAPYTALMLRMLNAPESRGWMADEEGYRLITDPWAMLFAAFVYHSNRDYNSMNLVDILRCAAGVDEHPEHLIYRPNAEEKKFADDFLEAQGLHEAGNSPLIGIQLGASQAKRQWPPAAFARLAKLLIERHNARLLIIGGKNEERIYKDMLRHYQHPNISSAMGQTTFGQLAALLEHCDLLVTGDTGPMHLSVAVGTPVVAMFLASALCFETGPYSRGNFVLQPQISCNPCNPNHPCAQTDCHGQITPELMAYLCELRLSVPLGQEADIELPEEYARQEQVSIYYTDFDSDGFLDFKLLSQAVERHGKPAAFFAAARETYKALWKEEFNGIEFTAVAKEVGKNITHSDSVHPSLEGIKQALKLIDQGCLTLDELSQAVKNPHTPAEGFKIFSERLKQIDQNIEEVGLTYPMLGAMIRIFLMEKENLRGEDVLKLAGETRELYQTLARRGTRFASIFSEFYRAESAPSKPAAGGLQIC